MPKVLITGGSGYLGQFLTRALARLPGYDVAFTYNSRSPSQAELAALGDPTALQADLRTGAGLDQCLSTIGAPDVIINCAAVSVPKDCETDPEGARALNIPNALLKWMDKHCRQSGREGATIQPALLIHLSTDQVYEGSKAFNKEDDPAQPVNTYGQTKVDAEQAVRAQWPNFAILRSSIIIGPAAPAIPLSKNPPLLWMDKALSSGQASTFFFDEFRCPVFVLDFVTITEQLISKALGGEQLNLVLNTGGPDRLSRAGMAEVLAQVRGYARATPDDVAAGAVAVETDRSDSSALPALSELISRVPAASATNRGVNSPLDISMDISRLTSTLGVPMTPFKDAAAFSLS